jgi:glycerophosphoryl diester phosphodiesterase
MRPRPTTVYGHRGAGRGDVVWGGRDVQENTLESFAAAVSAGVDGIETDVVRTRDGDLVLHHDTVLVDGTPIAALTLEQARRHGIAALADAFGVVPAHVRMIIEVKAVLGDVELPEAGKTTALVAAALRRERRERGRPLLTYGFDPSETPALAGTLAGSGVEVGLIADGGTDVALMTHAAVRLDADVVAGHTTSFLGSRAVEQIRPYTLAEVVAVGRRHGVRFLCWSPTPEQVTELVAAGVDAVCVDDVPRTLPIIRRRD